MKKKFTVGLLASAILVSSIAVFAACETSKTGAGGTNGKMNVRDVYAMSAVSSISYLSEEKNASALTASAFGGNYTAILTAATARPGNVTDEDVVGIENCIAAFDNILSGGGIDQTVKDNTSTDPRFSEYALEMTISMPMGSGEFTGYTMYFNELNKTTEVEMDDGEEETEERTTFEGVILSEEELFIVKGIKEVETEGRETETSLEFRTYKNIGVDAIQADEKNFVVVSQSVEKDEIEYEYSFYKNGRKVQEIELEYEEDRRGVELSFQIKDVSSGKVQETEYELRKKDNGFVVEFEKNGKEDRIIITKTADGYTFTYSNGFEETVK